MTIDKNYLNVVGKFNQDFPNLIKIASNEDEEKVLISLYNISKHSLKSFDKEFIVTAFDVSKTIKPKNINDLYSIVLFTALKSKPIVKKAYPYYPLIAGDKIDKEFNLQKWASLVYKIYDAVLSGDMTLLNAIDYYADSLDKDAQEDEKFKSWMKYYMHGEDKKYDIKVGSINKEADFQFGLNNSNFYYPETKSYPEVTTKEILENKLDDVRKKKELTEWKEKLYAAIRRIDKLIRSVESVVGPDKAVELAKFLYDFDVGVRKLQHEITATDLTHQTAQKFKKSGFKSGYDILHKIAQDLEQPNTTPIDGPTPDAMPEATQQEVSPQEAGTGGKSGDPVKRIYENASGAKAGEYEKLSGEIDLKDAIYKLEEIAARLSDRRVIRLLAEFDIMLDKIGIASMFPELSEAQSKLIDGYSYALIRVTKMLGMLSSGKHLAEISEDRKTELASGIRKDLEKSNQQSREGLEEPLQEEFGPEAGAPSATPPAAQAPEGQQPPAQAIPATQRPR